MGVDVHKRDEKEPHSRHMHRSDYVSPSPYISLSVFSPSTQGKRLPAYLSADAEEGEVSDDDSADEIEDDFKLKSSSNVRKRNEMRTQAFIIPGIDSFFFLNFNIQTLYISKR